MSGIKRVLIACEVSQTITKEFLNQGIQCYSCDIQPTQGNYPENHIIGDALKVAYNRKFDLMIAHPPCTYLAVSGAKHLYHRDGTINKVRLEQQKAAIQFVRLLLNAPIRYICIENPISVLSTAIRKPDQIIQPYYFGDPYQKTTCLWLKNLPVLKPTNIVNRGHFKTWQCQKTGAIKRIPLWYSNSNKETRSKTFPGIAKAMVEQWKSITQYQGEIQWNI